MRKLKKFMLSLAVLMLVIPLSIGLAGCGNTDDNGKTDGEKIGATTVIGTWTFGTRSSTNMITEVKVEATKVTITYKKSTGNGSFHTDCESSTQTVNGTSFTASENDPGNRNWSISGLLNDDGALVITGTITLISGYVSSQETVSATATGYTAAS